MARVARDLVRLSVPTFVWGSGGAGSNFVIPMLKTTTYNVPPAPRRSAFAGPGYVWGTILQAGVRPRVPRRPRAFWRTCGRHAVSGALPHPATLSIGGERPARTAHANAAVRWPTTAGAPLRATWFCRDRLRL